MCPLEFVCQREELLRGISIVERAATSKESMQILEGIYIRAEGDHLHLAATDLELSIECDVPATVVQQGEAVLGSKVLSPNREKARRRSAGLPDERIGGGPDRVGSVPFHGPHHGGGRVSRATRGGKHRALAHQPRGATPLDPPYGLCRGDRRLAPFPHRRLCRSGTRRNPPGRDRLQPLGFPPGKLLEETDRPRSGIVPVRALSELMRILDDDDDVGRRV